MRDPLSRGRTVGAALAAALRLAAVPGSASADGPRAQGSVVGGTSVRAGAYPWMVALSRGCGATLVAPDRVLTAAHCVEELRIAELRVYVGARRRTRGTLRYDGQLVPATDVASHPGYRGVARGGPRSDAAVIRLARPVTDVPLARLAGPGDAGLVDGGDLVSVVGWGVTRAALRNAPLAVGLRKGELRLLSQRTCSRIYGDGGGYRRSSMVCARSRQPNRRPNTSPCIGDSGGPLVAPADVQVGIVSYGISCGALHEPTVFTRVASVRPFIDDPEPEWSPQPVGRPRIEGTVAHGRLVRCVPPGWRNPVRETQVRWGANRLLIATGPQLRIPKAAIGRNLQCRVVARNAGGTTPSVPSAPIRVPRP